MNGAEPAQRLLGAGPWAASLTTRGQALAQRSIAATPLAFDLGAVQPRVRAIFVLSADASLVATRNIFAMLGLHALHRTRVAIGRRIEDLGAARAAAVA